MAERCPKTLLGVAVSGLSSLALFYYGVSIDQDLLYHVDTLLAATPAPMITLEEMMPAAIPSVIESYLPDFVTDFIYDLFSGHNWSSCLSIVVLIYAVYSSLKRDYRKLENLSVNPKIADMSTSDRVPSQMDRHLGRWNSEEGSRV